ncbi:MAG: hypothetical protein JWO11_1962 [Nocardioides sp.]|nr:hypothetical protein [Nocardioides sp.]
MFIALCADKGSPGVTTASLVLASAWRGPALVVEADPAGGDLGIRLRAPGGSALPEVPTVLSVATAARANHGDDVVSRHAHQFTKGVAVVAAPVAAEQLSGVGDWEPLAEVLASSALPVFADLGRLHGGSRVMPVAAGADLVIVVGRPEPASVIRLRDRLVRLAPELAAHRGGPPRLFALLIAPGRHGPGLVGDLGRILDDATARPFVTGLGFLAHDPDAVQRIEVGEDSSGRLARGALMRSARVVVDDLTPLVAPPARSDVVAVRGGAR